MQSSASVESDDHLIRLITIEIESVDVIYGAVCVPPQLIAVQVQRSDVDTPETKCQQHRPMIRELSHSKCPSGGKRRLTLDLSACIELKKRRIHNGVEDTRFALQ